MIMPVFNLEVSDLFIVKRCNKCKMDHAPVRDCIDSEGNKMYFDAVVLRKNTAVVLYNDTPEAVKDYLENSTEPYDNIRVIRGENLVTYEIPDYLNIK